MALFLHVRGNARTPRPQRGNGEQGERRAQRPRQEHAQLGGGGAVGADLHGQNIEYTFTERAEQEDVYIYTFAMESVAAICPQPITLRFAFAKDDVYCVFRPNACGICTLPPDWAMLESNSRSASGAPVLAFIGGKDNNRLTVALSDCKNPIRLRTGLHEEDCTVLCEVELFSDTVAPLNKYSVEIRLDFRDICADKSIKDVRAWWTSCGYVSAEMRGKGIGSRLFELTASRARAKGARKLYISAHSAVESQAFYCAMGCVDAAEPDAAHVAAEPFDRQLEYRL